MLIIRNIKDLHRKIDVIKKFNQTIGFIPTMGALHAGHMSLVDSSIKVADITVTCIFVNPTQFNEKSDLENYPRTEKEDLELLEQHKCDLVFIPSVEEIYDQDISCHADYGTLTNTLEGKSRPGHFNGVVTIVKRLFEIVTPDYGFFGEKDFQQLAIVKKLTEVYNLDVEVIGVPIKREESGLAMSSRNKLLSKIDIKNALSLSKTLLWCKNNRGNFKPQELANRARIELEENENVKLEYFEIVDPSTFEPLQEFLPNEKAIALVAGFVGDVRLIDNSYLPDLTT